MSAVQCLKPCETELRKYVSADLAATVVSTPTGAGEGTHVAGCVGGVCSMCGASRARRMPPITRTAPVFAKRQIAGGGILPSSLRQSLV